MKILSEIGLTVRLIQYGEADYGIDIKNISQDDELITGNFDFPTIDKALKHAFKQLAKKHNRKEIQRSLKLQK